jgi:hypothetical protein
VEVYVKQILSKRFLPIPYLHNLEVVKDIGLSPSLSKNQMFTAIGETTAVSLDNNPTNLRQKKTRIMDLLQVASNPFVVIPLSTHWVIAKCGTKPRIDCTDTVLLKVKNSHEKTMIMTNDFPSAKEVGAFEPCFALGLDIIEYVVINKPNIRLPPVSLQRIMNPDVVKIISEHFK